MFPILYFYTGIKAEVMSFFLQIFFTIIKMLIMSIVTFYQFSPCNRYSTIKYVKNEIFSKKVKNFKRLGKDYIVATLYPLATGINKKCLKSKG